MLEFLRLILFLLTLFLDADLGIYNLKSDALHCEKWHSIGNDFTAGKTNPPIYKEMSEDKNFYNRRQFTHVWIQLLLISLKVDTTSAENTFRCFTLNVLWQHFNYFQNILFLLQDIVPNFDDKQRCQFACLDFSLHICWNIAKWD